VKFSFVLVKDSLGEQIMLRRHVSADCELKERSVLIWIRPLTCLGETLRMRICSFLDFVNSCICKA